MKRFLIIGFVAFGINPQALEIYSDLYNGTELFPSPLQKGQIELKYDSGIPYVIVAFNNGVDMWVGNDFDTTEHSTGYPRIDSIRLYCYDAWPPPAGFDGSYLAIYDYTNGAPGDMIWPTDSNPMWIVPSDNGFQDFTVDWQTTTRTFVTANNQYNDYPNCDPFLTDDNLVDQNHSWVASDSTWQRFKDNDSLQDTTNGYNNLMMRVIITPSTEIESSSLGGIKAMYR
ncbi:MAG: hypothetical protein GY771_11320 [bacterium]|nr:hypothetical protein [bacterium]